MGLPVSLELALKYLRPRRSFFSIVTLLSVSGILLGVAVPIVVMAIMTGFGNMWRETLMSFSAHVTVQGAGLRADDEETLARIRSVESVQAISPSITSLVVVERRDEMMAPYVRGIVPELERKTSGIHKFITEGTFDVEDDECVLGRDLAIRLGVRTGDVINVYSPAGFSDAKTIRLPEEIEVVGIFRMGMQMLDEAVMLTSLDTARELANLEDDEAVTEFVVQIDDPDRAVEVADEIERRLGRGHWATNWIHQNYYTFAALKTEKDMMFFILLPISLIASFCVACSLILITTQKIRDIGLLKSMGYSGWHIVGIFVCLGFMEGLVGVLLGVGLGVLLVQYRNEIMDLISAARGTEVFPPEIYQFSKLPADLVASDVLIIAGVALLISMLAGALVSLYALFLRPVVALQS